MNATKKLSKARNIPVEIDNSNPVTVNTVG